MKFKQCFFPAQSRSFYGKRWLDIALRTLHLLGLLGVSGGIIFHAEQALWQPYLLTTILSGSSMVLLSLWTNGRWLLQNRGLTIIVKIIILSILPVFPGYELYLLFSMVIISGFSSHAPGRFRYYSPFFGQQI